MAHMFRESRAEHAMVLLDEADSFLTARQGAQYSWEVTMVNELLVQLEDFEGIVLCAMNLMERLDPAVFRRFTCKIRFGYLRSDQRWNLFRELAQTLQCPLDPPASMRSQRQLDMLTNLTPGDFTVVLRHIPFLGRACSCEDLVMALVQESQMKEYGKKPVRGFLVETDAR